MSQNRYDGKPFLRLLECYVLNAIGELQDSERLTLSQMEPKLSKVYKTNGSWLDIVAKEMDFPDSLPEQIVTIWSKVNNQAQEQALTADPDEFAKFFVDQNFTE